LATYAIGDVQGCAASLERLLEELPFDDTVDRLWLVGDLVNRGPRSLDVLTWAHATAGRLGERFRVVLGNHDLHLLAAAAGASRPSAGDTLDEVLQSPERDTLLAWLVGCPLAHRETLGGRPHLLVHAGLLPNWSAVQAEALAREAHVALSGADGGAALAATRRLRPERFEDGMTGELRLAAVVAALTRLRSCTADGRMCLDAKGPPADAPPGCLPWFDVPGRASSDHVVVCGHWAALGLLVRDDLVALDSGCVWGGALTAVRLEDRAVFQVPAVERGRDPRP
jgi:bis(5'-nucleosyl)-tetraphosphatase (symmetrical)